MAVFGAINYQNIAISGAINRQNMAISGAINSQKGQQVLYDELALTKTELDTSQPHLVHISFLELSF